MTLALWGRGLFVWGLIAAVVSAAPAGLLMLLPAEFGSGFLGLLAIMLSISVTPLALVAASAGAILLLAAAFRRDRP
jgi:hypothetical protein